MKNDKAKAIALIVIYTFKIKIFALSFRLVRLCEY